MFYSSIRLTSIAFNFFLRISFKQEKMAKYIVVVCVLMFLLVEQTSALSPFDQLQKLNKYIELKSGQIQSHHGPSAKLNSFKFTNCGSKTDQGEISSIIVRPDPLTKDTNISFSFNASIKEVSLKKPVSLNVTLKALLDGQWRVLPCYGVIGSCVYDDICDIISELDCPQVLIKHGIQCHCPYAPGRYVLPTTYYYLKDGLYPTTYSVNLVFSRMRQRVACAGVNFAFA